MVIAERYKVSARHTNMKTEMTGFNLRSFEILSES